MWVIIGDHEGLVQVWVIIGDHEGPAQVLCVGDNRGSLCG